MVTAPTNGAAGIVPAVLGYYRRFESGATDEDVQRFLLGNRVPSSTVAGKWPKASSASMIKRIMAIHRLAAAYARPTDGATSAVRATARASKKLPHRQGEKRRSFI